MYDLTKLSDQELRSFRFALQREMKRRGGLHLVKRIRKTHCIYDHAMTGDNLYINNRGDYVCRACLRRRSAAYWKRKNNQE